VLQLGNGRPKSHRRTLVYELDYNQLKRLLLRTLEEAGPTPSTTLFDKLRTASGQFEVHAVRMALVRYYRQGLLRRERSAGEFVYTISNRGIARLRWLEEQTQNSRER